jgi:hypothetical protein
MHPSSREPYMAGTQVHSPLGSCVLSSTATVVRPKPFVRKPALANHRLNYHWRTILYVVQHQQMRILLLVKCLSYGRNEGRLWLLANDKSREAPLALCLKNPFTAFVHPRTISAVFQSYLQCWLQTCSMIHPGSDCKLPEF